MRSKRVGSAEALDRERPMSWEGELSDQEVSQMDQEGIHHPSAGPSILSATTPTPPQQPPPPLPTPHADQQNDMALRPLKTEPIHEEEGEEELDEDEHEMEGIQSAGPGSPQPMCTNAGGEALEADEQHFVMPPPALSSMVHHHPPIAEIKTELPWTECPKADLVAGIRPSPPLTSTGAANSNSVAGASNAGSTPTAPQQRPTFGEAFTGHTPLASPLTSRHPIRLPLAAASGKTLSDRSVSMRMSRCFF